MDYINLIRKYSEKNQINIYLVGGAVRDILLGKKPSDYDFAVSGDCHGVARKISDILGGTYIEMHPEVGRVAAGKDVLDFTNLKGTDIIKDLMARDFTINAIALDLGSGEYIDPLGGIRDVEDREIRLASPHAFEDDPIRILRAVRLSSKLGFTIEGKTIEVMEKSSSLLGGTAGERIVDELYKILECRESYIYFNLMEELGVLREILPITRQSLLTLKFFEEGIEDIYDSPDGGVIRKHLCQELKGRKRVIYLKLAILLQDIVHPNTSGLEYRDKELLQEFVKKTSNPPFSIIQRSIIIDVITGYLRLHNLLRQKVTDREIYEYFIEFGDNTPDILIYSIFRMDAEGLYGGNKAKICRNFVFNLLNRYFKYKNMPKGLATGRDVMEITGARGKDVGSILRSLEEQVFYENIKTREDALNFIKCCRGEQGEKSCHY